MSRTVALVALVGLVAAGAASAKGPDSGTVCGATGCQTIRGEARLLPLQDWWSTPFALRAAPAPARYYRIRLAERGTLRWILLYAPSRNSMRIWGAFIPGQGEIGPYWRTVPRDARTRIRPLLRGVTPYAAPARWPR